MGYDEDRKSALSGCRVSQCLLVLRRARGTVRRTGSGCGMWILSIEGGEQADEE